MKVHYSKYNVERARPFQLSTTVYEENGEKYVKKEALTPEAKVHLQEMKRNYRLLSETIIDPRLKLAPIIDESETSLTFAFIEGESLEKRYYKALNEGEVATHRILQEYVALLEKGFKTTPFTKEHIEPQHKALFGSAYLGHFYGTTAFEGVSNVDLIFSNLIFKEDSIYIIDYEWVFPIIVPIGYSIYRAMSILPDISEETYREFNINNTFFAQIEKHFVDEFVMKNGFYHYQENYKQEHIPVIRHVKELTAVAQGHYKEKEFLHKTVIRRKDTQIDTMNGYIAKLLSDLNQAHYIHSRLMYHIGTKQTLKRWIIKALPSFILDELPSLKNHELNSTMESFQLDSIPEISIQGAEEDSKPQYTYQEPVYSEVIEDELNRFMHTPLISIVMPVYNVDPKWLNIAIDSVKEQWYTNWELCIADDKSTNQETVNFLKSIDDEKVHITFLDENLNISGASNAAISLANGEYIALLDNDDKLTPDALYEMVKAINLYKADFIYSDEDFITVDEVCIEPHFKPDFSPDLLLAHNYITHFTCFRRSLLDEVGLFNSLYDGSQDYDLFLRLTEKAHKIHHIPKVLYHWRMLETSTSTDSRAKPEAIKKGMKLLKETLKRRGVDARVLSTFKDHYYRVEYPISSNPLVSIVIPFKDKPELLKVCVESLLEKTAYKHYEIIGISNRSEERETFELMKQLEAKDGRVKFYEYNVPFNYSQINNYAVNTYAKGEHILLLNNDIEVINEDWLSAMVEHSQREEVGCVGAKLYYPDDTIQHAGIIIGLGGYAGHSHKMLPSYDPGYFNRLNVVQNMSAVTGACLLVKKSLYQETGGLDGVAFQVAYNDVDFCLRIRELGYLNIFTPHAELYHHESKTRGYEITPEKRARFQKEKDALYARHKKMIDNGDPYYNPNLTHDKEDFSICQK
jgi:GT2 family glycosyltransferase